MIIQIILILKITDFGLSKIMGNSEKTNEGFGTINYASPEILLRIPYGKEIEALGILLFFILTGRYPFLGINQEELAENIVFENLSFNVNEWEIRSFLIRDLIQKSLVKEANLRIDIKGFLRHEWFKQCKKNSM